MDTLKNLIKYFVLNLVENQEVVTVTDIQTEDKNLIEIKVAANDLAKIIGKEGRTFKSLRSLIQAIDPESKKDLVVDVVK